MASQKIQLNLSELRSALNSLDSSISEFKSYTKNFHDSTRDELKSFNSDFIEEVDALLDNMHNDSQTQLLNNLDAIYQAGDMLLEKMKETDEKIGTTIRSNTE